MKNISIENLDNDLLRELSVYYVNAFDNGMIDIAEVVKNEISYKRRGYYGGQYFELKCIPGDYFKLITLDNTGMVIGDLVPVINKMIGLKRPTFTYNYASRLSDGNACITVYDWDLSGMHYKSSSDKIYIEKDYDGLEPENIRINPLIPCRTELSCYRSLVAAYKSLGLEFGSDIPEELKNTQEFIIIDRTLNYIAICLKYEFYDAESCKELMNISEEKLIELVGIPELDIPAARHKRRSLINTCY